MDDGDALLARPGHAHPFSVDEIGEFESRFSDHELSGVELDPARALPGDE